jgi:hypothetical protein
MVSMGLIFGYLPEMESWILRLRMHGKNTVSTPSNSGNDLEEYV